MSSDITLCGYCNEPGATHRDHVIPRSRGGGDEPENLLMACPSCNMTKSDRTPSEWKPHGLHQSVYLLEATLKQSYSMRPRSPRGIKSSPHESTTNPREPKEDKWGVPRFDMGQVSPGKWGSLNPFEDSMANEFGSLPSNVRGSIVNVHDDMYVARTIALSIYGRRWHRHVAEIYQALQDRFKLDGSDES